MLYAVSSGMASGKALGLSEPQFFCLEVVVPTQAVGRAKARVAEGSGGTLGRHICLPGKWRRALLSVVRLPWLELDGLVWKRLLSSR